MVESAGDHTDEVVLGRDPTQSLPDCAQFTGSE
jgi:hypothetical protein